MPALRVTTTEDYLPNVLFKKGRAPFLKLSEQVYSAGEPQYCSGETCQRRDWQESVADHMAQWVDHTVDHMATEVGNNVSCLVLTRTSQSEFSSS
jgi:hypothetical protein